MKRTNGVICLIAGICLLFGACSKSNKTYEERIKDEKKRISRFISEHDIVVLKEYPSNGVFKENEFFLDPSGVYINVVDSGNGNRANPNRRADVYFRFAETMSLPAAESDTFNLSDISLQPLHFKYGESSTYSQANSAYLVSYRFMSPGVVLPLKYVGENAIIRLIIPFKSATGSVYQTASYSTLYYGRLEYTKIIN